MIRSDNHVHSLFSTDSNASMEDIIRQAKIINLSSVCFTDHMDYDWPDTSAVPEKDTGKTPEFVFEPEPYFQAAARLKKEFPEFSIRTGIELGLKKSVLKKAQELIKQYPFDFVIGSTHLVDDLDPYEPEYWEAYGEEKGILRYYEITLENILLPFDYDVYGHIDYILRNCPAAKSAIKEGRSLEPLYEKIFSEREELLREILSSLIKNGKGIEINTAGFKYGLGHPNPHEALISLYKKLGGKIITVGSDAHQPEHIGYDFEKVPDLLKKAGFSHYTEFHGREPLTIPLD